MIKPLKAKYPGPNTCIVIDDTKSIEENTQAQPTTTHPQTEREQKSFYLKTIDILKPEIDALNSSSTGGVDAGNQS